MSGPSPDEDASETPEPSHPGTVRRALTELQPHMTLVVSAVLTTLVVLRVAIASGFDVSVALAMLTAGGSAQVLLGIAVSLLPFGFFAGASLSAPYLVRYLRGTNDWVFNVVAAGSFFLLVAALTPWFGFIGAVLLFGMGLRPRKDPRPLPRFFYLALFSVVVVFLFYNAVWLPPEVMEVDGHGQVLGYLLNDDGRWATILVDDPREILIVHSSALESRQACSVDEFPRTIPQQLSGKPSQPDCEALLKPQENAPSPSATPSP
jgi:hypothetical protein